jgi:hypothetical protein
MISRAHLRQPAAWDYAVPIGAIPAPLLGDNRPEIRNPAVRPGSHLQSDLSTDLKGLRGNRSPKRVVRTNALDPHPNRSDCVSQALWRAQAELRPEARPSDGCRHTSGGHSMRNSSRPVSAVSAL